MVHLRRLICFFFKIISTNKNQIAYILDKMLRHSEPKVQFYLMLYLSECGVVNNQGMILEDDFHRMLIDINYA
jgi:hypothetical protein